MLIKLPPLNFRSVAGGYALTDFGIPGPVLWAPRGVELSPDQVYFCKLGLDPNKRWGGEKLILRLYPRDGVETHALLLLPSEIKREAAVFDIEEGKVGFYGYTIAAVIPFSMSHQILDIVHNLEAIYALGL